MADEAGDARVSVEGECVLCVFDRGGGGVMEGLSEGCFCGCREDSGLEIDGDKGEICGVFGSSEVNPAECWGVHVVATPLV